MSGEPLPYLLRSDWMITAILFSCLVLVSYVLSKGKKYLLQQLKTFVSNRERSSLFDEGTSDDIHYTFILMLHTCVLQGFCIYNYFASTTPVLFQKHSHYLLLGGFIACMVLLLLFKGLSYAFVNWIFFDKARNASWMTAYYHVTIWSGFLLLPIVLLIVYFDFSLRSTLYFIAFVIIFAKITLFYKCFSNFFTKFYGSFHLFLYLCTLEILPDLLMWKGIVLANNLLIQ